MIRVAILGAGIGREHLAGYSALPNKFSVAALVDKDRARAREVVGDRDIRVEGEIAAILKNPEIDLIDVCLPPPLHFPVTRDALQAGKHVVCEKPLATSLAEADQLLALVKARGRVLSPVFQYRYGPAMSELNALIDAGLTGKPYAASLETHWDRDAAYYAVPWRGTWAGEQGGAVLGHAIHGHDLLTTILGPVDTVFAFTATRVNDIEVEDCAAISVRMQNGALATSSTTLGAGGNTSRLRICFQGLTAESGSSPYAPADAKWRFVARAPTEQSRIDAVLREVKKEHAGFAGFFEALADALDHSGDRAVTPEDGRRSIELVTAIYQSARDGRPVQLPLTETNPLYHGWLPQS